MQYLIKLLLSAALIVLVSEISKRSTLLGGLLASLPLTSVIAMIWLWVDTKDAGRIAELSTQIFWLVLPSFTLFLSLPWMLKRGMAFPLSLGLASGLTACAYWLMMALLRRFGISA